MASPTREFARRVAALEKRVKDGATIPQLVHSSIDDGSLPVVDASGTTTVIVGKQFDGTYTVAPVAGPAPPVPAGGTVDDSLGGFLKVDWDGTFADGAVAPMDFARVSVHLVDPAMDLATFDPISQNLGSGNFTSATGGTVWAASEVGLERRVLMVTWSQSGKPSAPFDAGTGTVATSGLDVNSPEWVALMAQASDAETAATDAQNQIAAAGLPAMAASIEVFEGWRKTGTTQIDGGLIYTDSIVAGSIAAGAIQAAHIAVGAIVAGHIAVGQIQAGHIAAGAISAVAIAADAIDGKVVTSAMIRTAASGARAEIGGNTMSSAIRFWMGAGGEGPGNTGGIGGIPDFSGGHIVQMSSGISSQFPGSASIALRQSTGSVGDIVLNGVVSATYGIAVPGNIIQSSGISNLRNLTVTAGALAANGGINVGGDQVYMAGLATTNGTYDIRLITGSGKIVVNDAPSRLEWKDNVEILDDDKRALAAISVRPIRWTYNDQAPRYERMTDPDAPRMGFALEDIMEAGFDEAIVHDPDGEAEGVDYSRWPIRQQVAIRYLHRKLLAKEAAIDELSAVVSALTERIEALER